MDYIQESPIWNDMVSNDEVAFARSIVATKSNLSNFSANVIHDLQVLGLVHTKMQKAMKFVSE
ncbi:hypothetical protein MtrunA17_Chr3g0103141 [Medicago truncatula]|uniref:Uncharacterized protein n=1 Tax=Medicago truncatula TaxID=3880 RepID=A0A396IX27_MEDTR|nr:hypothetical protein MtrunA17_Chr3g0103141 [Medicago truncatula]